MPINSSDARGKIVIIEDQKDLRILIEKKLNKEGYQTLTATNGPEGLQMITQNIPDLVLLDIMLPEMNGYQVLEEIKKNPNLAKIPVVIISNSEPDEKKLDALGVQDFLVKADLTPEQISEKIAEQIKNHKKEKTAERPAAKVTSNGKQTKILLIEDDEILRDLCVTKLKKENFEVLTAIEGIEGLKKIAEDKPDLVLLDIILPGIDGFEVMKRMQALSKEIAETPVILLTNLGQESDIEKGEALGAADYLVKANFTTEEIIEKIKQVLKKDKGSKK